MTTMDSDSESQDSDDGRRFRFEATRKDNVQQESKLGKQSRSKSERDYGHNDAQHEDKRNRIENSDFNKGAPGLSKERDNDNRDLKHSAKYLKHSLESRSSRREDNKNYRSAKDVSSNSKNSPLYSKHKTKDTKRYRSRDRDEHRCGRSQERCRSKNENEKSQSEKYRNKSHERYKHYTSDKNRDKNYQSNKVRSTDLAKLRGMKVMKNDEGEHLQECTSTKNVEQGQSGDELLAKGDCSVESQEYKELNLSEFDILSETDENMSDDSDVKIDSPLLRHQNKKAEKRNLDSEYENASKKQAIEFEALEGSPKVNARKNDELYGSSNNNSGTISDSTLGTTSPILTESRKSTIDLNSEGETLITTENTSLHPNNYDSVKDTDNEVSLSEMHVERNTTYGPVLPPQLTINSPDNTGKDVQFIGPCLPRNDVQSMNERIEEDTVNCISRDSVISKEFDSDLNMIFGPALPPHLLKQTSNDETDTKIIDSTLADTINTFNNNAVDQTESDNDDGIGPLPPNHPALESNYVYRQLEQRAQQMKNEQRDEVCGMVNQREEWMTELPPAEMNNVGLTARKFRIRAGPDMSDRSCWTDTPAKKAAKEKQKEEEKICNVKTSIRELSEDRDDTESCETKKREKSLLEIHQSKLRKKKRKEEKKAKATGQTVRRPFDRDIDLQISRFDQAQKKTIINKAQHLDERFSRGKY